MTPWIKSLLRRLLGDYEIYVVLSTTQQAATRPRASAVSHFTEVQADAVSASSDELVRQQAGYAGPGSDAYACIDGARIVGVCFYWHGERYRTRNFWPLQPGEAKLVQIVTVPDMRGRGIARSLIEHSAARMFDSGYRRVYARVWHSNLPSLAAFKAAGWGPVALVITVNPLRLSRPWRLRLPWLTAKRR